MVRTSRQRSSRRRPSSPKRLYRSVDGEEAALKKHIEVLESQLEDARRRLRELQNARTWSFTEAKGVLRTYINLIKEFEKKQYESKTERQKALDRLKEYETEFNENPGLVKALEGYRTKFSDGYAWVFNPGDLADFASATRHPSTNGEFYTFEPTSGQPIVLDASQQKTLKDIVDVLNLNQQKIITHQRNAAKMGRTERNKKRKGPALQSGGQGPSEAEGGGLFSWPFK